MDFLQMNSIASSGSSAADVVASALTKQKATAKDSTSGTSSTSSSSSSSSSTASDSSDITANDFLTLLVSELQNQDPTQPTDPNEYITQLAQVNSLQQLVSINQGIGTLDSAVTSTSSSSSSGSSSGSSSNAVADVTNANAALGLQSAQGQNAVWGGSTAS